MSSPTKRFGDGNSDEESEEWDEAGKEVEAEEAGVLVLVSLCDSDETIEACERFSAPAGGCSWSFG
jgi:hypothetical protein